MAELKMLESPTGAAKDVVLNPIYVTNPECKMDWFYCLFGRCFAKPVLIENKIFHVVCCFQYSTDGKGSYGCHVPPGETYPIDEPELYHPDNECCAVFLCGICLSCRWKKYSENYKKRGEQYADYMYYGKNKHYNYHVCCSPDFAE